MPLFKKSFNKGIATILKRGGIGIIPTDTIYGIVGRASSKKAVSRIYSIKKRNLKKPFIILISSINDLKKFGINASLKTWPPKTSMIFKCPDVKFKYLHRGTKSLAFRIPVGNSALNAILKKTGPLVAPSANPEGGSPARTIRQAEKYFGQKVDFYIDGGHLNRKPSKLLKIRNGQTIYLRK